MSYAPGSPEKRELKAAIAETRAVVADIPMIIGGKEVRTGKMIDIRPPHDHAHLLGRYHQGDHTHVRAAIDAALAAKPAWERMRWESRAAIFLKAADLLAGPYRQLPHSSPGTWNRVEWRALEGFVWALTPFNFTSIAGNLPSAPALMGNVCVWKPSKTAVYSAHLIMQILKEAGLPDGVINLVYCSGPAAAEVMLKDKNFAGIHFTGSTGVFNDIWANIVKNISNYRSYPRIVGETGGKDYIFADPTADPVEVATAMTRGAFEYQGQKCSAASRAYIPASLWPAIACRLKENLAAIKTGGVEDFTNFVNAVIDEASFDKLARAIDDAKAAPDAEIVAGGTHDKSKGYFITPTVIRVSRPDYITMQEELFGPVLTVFVYDDAKIDETLDLLDSGSIYALTGAIFSNDRANIEKLTERLTHTAGNFYINDKPTGAVVDQQPFGGGRASGTNDKAGTMFNLLRWVSPRTIKETFIPARECTYPNFLEE